MSELFLCLLPPSPCHLPTGIYVKAVSCSPPTQPLPSPHLHLCQSGFSLSTHPYLTISPPASMSELFVALRPPNSRHLLPLSLLNHSFSPSSLPSLLYPLSSPADMSKLFLALLFRSTLILATPNSRFQFTAGMETFKMAESAFLSWRCDLNSHASRRYKPPWQQDGIKNGCHIYYLIFLIQAAWDNRMPNSEIAYNLLTN